MNMMANATTDVVDPTNTKQFIFETVETNHPVNEALIKWLYQLKRRQRYFVVEDEFLSEALITCELAASLRPFLPNAMAEASPLNSL